MTGAGHTGFQAARRRAVALLALALFMAWPFVVFHSTVEDAATDFRLEFVYLVSGWAPWVLILLGSLCFLPVVVSIGRDVFSRWALSPGIRHAYEAWGITLYLLGVLLAVQTSQVAGAF
ncbi:MAG TPA: hypothetical protein VF520_11585 [Thermoleophilaceae bacterium]